MLDNGKYTIHYSTREELHHVLGNPSISFQQVRTNTHTGEKVHLHSFRNLTLAVNYRLLKVNLTGSLTTFVKGNNYSNLTFSELSQAITTISETLNTRPEHITIHRLEYSLIIKTPLQPSTYLGYLLSYKKKEFYKQIPPAWSAKPLLSFCGLQQFVIKFYDTAKWHKLPSVKLLKYEIRFTRAEKILSIINQSGPLTFAHLLNQSHLLLIGNFAIKVYQSIDKENTLTPARYRKLTVKQRRLLFAGERPDFWKMERAVNKNTCKKDRALYLTLKRQLKCDKDNLMNDLERKIIDTVNSLSRG